MAKSPINYFGGKFYQAPEIISMFPEHKVYVEVFGGSGSVLFAKPRSEIEVYNDIYSVLVDFFRILRDPLQAQELHRLLQLTPYSRKEFKECGKTWEQENGIERARRWYVSLMQSFSKSIGGKENMGWSFSKSQSRRGMSQCTSQWLSKIDDNLPEAVERLRNVQIENVDYKDLIATYDGKDTLFYLDPPYVHDTRKMTFTYEHEMTDEEHNNMIDILLKIKGKALLSGYDHKIYDRLVRNGWQRLSIGEYDKRSMSHNTRKAKGEEIVWINYALNASTNIFRD
jgi:DNA adenine methylase